jgi:hypothetical protein
VSPVVSLGTPLYSSAWSAHPGPFQTPNGLFIVLRGGTGEVQMRRSTDAGLTWAAYGPAWTPGTQALMSACAVGSVLYVLSADQAQVVSNRFDTGTGTWGGHQTVVTFGTQPASGAVAVAATSDGRIVAAYNGDAYRTMGTNYQRTYYRVGTIGAGGAVTWGAELSLDTLGTATTTSGAQVRGIAHGASGRVHLFYTIGTGTHQRTVTAASTLGTQSTAFSVGSGGLSLGVLDSAGVHAVYRDTDGRASVVSFVSADAPALSHAVASDHTVHSSGGMAATITAYDGTRRLIYARDTSRLWRTDNAGSGWGADTEVATNTAIYVASGAYEHEGGVYLGVVFAPVGTTASASFGRITLVEPPVYEQGAWRFRNDDGNESAATWKEALNTGAEIVAGERFRLRTVVENTGSAGVIAFGLEAKKGLDVMSVSVEGPDLDLRISGDGSGSRERIGQTFTTSATTTRIAAVRLRVRKVEGLPTDSVFAELAAAMGGVPLATSRMVPHSEIANSYEWITFDFPSPVPVSPSTSYAIMFRRVASDMVNAYALSDDSDDIYAGGEQWERYSGVWSADPGRDISFQVMDSVGGPWQTLPAQATPGVPIRYADSPNLTDGETTTQQISAGSFAPGRVYEAPSADALAIGAGQVTEVEAVVEVVEDVPGATILGIPTTSSSSQAAGEDGVGEYSFAQSATLGASFVCRYAEFRLRHHSGTAPETARIAVHEGEGGGPVIALSEPRVLPSVLEPVVFRFASPVALQANQPYTFRLVRDGVDGWVEASINLTDVYPDGKAYWYNISGYEPQGFEEHTGRDWRLWLYEGEPAVVPGDTFQFRWTRGDGALLSSYASLPEITVYEEEPPPSEAPAAPTGLQVTIIIP